MNQKEIEARIPEWRDKWLKVGLCTDAADFVTAEKAIKEIYTILGHEVPPFVWCSSPIDAQLKIHLGHVYITEGKPCDEKTVAKLYDLKTGWEELLEAIKAGKVDVSLSPQTTRDLAYEPTGLWGQLDFPWVSFDTFGRDVAGLECSDRDSKLLDLWAEVTKSAMCWWPFIEACFVSDRPHVINVDERYRLHSETEQAMAWRDSFDVYAIEGIPFSPNQPYVVTDPSKITVEEVTNEQNQERRRILMQRMGWERYMRETDAKLVHKDDHGELYEFTDGTNTIKVVKVWNGTANNPLTEEEEREFADLEERTHPWEVQYRLAETGDTLLPPDDQRKLDEFRDRQAKPKYEEYYLRVRPQIMTAKEAVMSTFPDVTEEEFDEMVRT
jgi:hypothetical protein